MALYGTPKGKDRHPENEGREPKKGMSKTEIQNLMRQVMGQTEGTPSSPSPLLPNKGGRRGVR